MYLSRKIDIALNEWMQDANHKPLLLRGARQTGKTTAIRHLAEKFDDFIEINFEMDKDIHAIFKGNLDIPAIVSQLAVHVRKPIVPGKTLLFFDEVQACPEAISSLRYFYEQMQPLHVVATGSLLEFAFEELSDFGVGRIRNMFIHPFSFAEFLSALGLDMAMEYARKASFNQPLPEIVHTQMLDALKAFLIVGGMPAAVRKYVDTKDFLAAQQEQEDILMSLKADFGKYRTRMSPDQIRRTFTAVVRQTGEKFTYSDPVVGQSLQQVKNCIGLLKRARIIYQIHGCMANGIPLGGDINPKQSKFMLLDTGLYLCESGLDVSTWILDPPARFVNRGRLAEMFVGLELMKAGSPLKDNGLFYWHREARNSNAEVDYIIQFANRVLPIEVKSGTRGSMKSLRILMNEKHLTLGVRTSEENLGAVDDIRIIPLYLIGEYDTLLRAK